MKILTKIPSVCCAVLFVHIDCHERVFLNPFHADFLDAKR